MLLDISGFHLADQPQQGQSDKCAEYANADGQKRDGNYIAGGREIAELFRSMAAFAAAQQKGGDFLQPYLDGLLSGVDLRRSAPDTGMSLCRGAL